MGNPFVGSTNPFDACDPNPLAIPTGDCDLDGLTNVEENTIGSDPSNPDTDGDGIMDGTEVGNPFNPTDSDGDGMLDVLESNIADLDGDGVVDQQDVENANDCVPNSNDCTPVFNCVNIQASVWLEGAYESGSMHTKLNDLGYLPGQPPSTFFGLATAAGQPYDASPWNYNGAEGNGMSNYAATVTDWVLVSLRTDISKSSEVCTRAGLLHSNGTIELIQTANCCQLDITKSYYIVIEHRNHLIVMAHQKQPVTGGAITYDFRTQQSYKGLLGFGQKQIGGAYVMYAGNGFQSTTNDLLNIISNDKNEWLNENGEHSSYYFYDFDLNGDTNVQDKNLWLNNNGVFSDVPRQIDG